VLRHRQATLVGRERELALLEDELTRARTENRARLVTVVAQAGLGKSRLVEELISRAGTEATTLRGRALAYGDGITFWPLVEAVRQAAGIQNEDRVDEAVEKLGRLAAGRDDVIARVASAIGLADQSFPLQELFWATRELLQQLARERPLVVAFEDLHWLSRPSSTSSRASPTASRRRSTCSATRGPSCSTHGPAGASGPTRRSSCSSR